MRLRLHSAAFALAILLTLPSSTLAQGLATPKAVFRANIDATGGMSAWNNVKTMHTSGEIVIDMDMATLIMTTDTWLIKPDYLLTKMSILEAPEGMPTGDNTVYITPEEAWIDSFNGRQQLSSLPPAQQASIRGGMFGKEEMAFLSQPDSLFSMLDPKEVNGSNVYVIEIKGDASTRRLYDQKTLLMTGVEMQSPMDGSTVTSFASDYREVGGVIVSHATTADFGQMSQTMTVKRAEINGDITPGKLAEMSK